jgi:ferredoxin-type protein NapG
MSPLADYLEKRLPSALHTSRPLLRPPGALQEADFLATCHRCGKCVEACPADAIRPLMSADPALNKTPHVDPDLRACVLCDELACMKVCPSGALQWTDRHAIRMGLAVVDFDLCLRSADEPCTLCVDRCPLGKSAIRLDDNGRVKVLSPDESGHGCTGCGVCQEACPTRPTRAIRVHPLS